MTVTTLLARLQQDKIVVVQEQTYKDAKIYLLGYAPFDPARQNYPLDVTNFDRTITDTEFDVTKRWFPVLSSESST
ncbi:MAG: hypothetical protein WAL32_12455 [Terriglobales bacterium]